MTQTCYGFIFARGGSEGVKNKNTRMLNGKPLLAYAIEAAKACPLIDKVVVSTDDNAIAELAESLGAEVPFIRPADLASAEASEWQAWQHAVQFFQEKGEYFDVFVSVPCTSPLRRVEDITGAIECLDRNTDLVLTCVKSKNNPSFNMLKPLEGGGFGLVMPTENTVVRRQDASETYDIKPVAYVTRPNYILSHNSLLESRNIAVYEVDESYAVDIDTEFDFKVAELLIQNT